ncbi:hypothetical protein ACIU1J_04375 [Azospirillum doebereinerae]|uniref:hypothetical protein n=1 Tax=Azospirillum doebereinerae TaxID=92933 RepID=UPI00384CAF3D
MVQVSSMAHCSATRRARCSWPGVRDWTVAIRAAAFSTSWPCSSNAFSGLAWWISSVGVSASGSRWERSAMPIVMRAGQP